MMKAQHRKRLLLPASSGFQSWPTTIWKVRDCMGNCCKSWCNLALFPEDTVSQGHRYGRRAVMALAHYNVVANLGARNSSVLELYSNVRLAPKQHALRARRTKLFLAFDRRRHTEVLRVLACWACAHKFACPFSQQRLSTCCMGKSVQGLSLYGP